MPISPGPDYQVLRWPNLTEGLPARGAMLGSSLPIAGGKADSPDCRVRARRSFIQCHHRLQARLITGGFKEIFIAFLSRETETRAMFVVGRLMSVAFSVVLSRRPRSARALRLGSPIPRPVPCLPVRLAYRRISGAVVGVTRGKACQTTSTQPRS